MIKKWVLWVSARYMRTNRRGRRLSPGMLSAAGIGVGVMALITVISVMNGFQMGFIEDILEISSFHLRASGIEKDKAEEIAGIDGVRSVVPFAESQSLINTDYSMEPCLIRGLSADAEELDPALFNQLNIVSGSYRPEIPDGIVVGRIMAYKMGVSVGDSVSVIAMNGAGFSMLRPEDTGFIVTGIFKSGYNDFDSSLIIMSTDALRMIDGAAEVKYGIKLDNRFRDDAAAEKIARLTGIGADQIESWRIFNRAFFSALKLEKIMMFIMLGLIFLVVSFGIFNSTRRTVAEKQEEIGIMRAIGATPRQIRQIFVLDGIIIGLSGGLIGTAAGMLLTLNVNRFLAVFARSSASFLINVPVRIVASEVITIFAFAMFFCIFSAWIASRKVSKITPQEVLRYE